MTTELTPRSTVTPPPGVRVVDADTHIVEVGDLWTSRAPASLRDHVPHVEEVDGAPTWVMEGTRLGWAYKGTVIARDGTKAETVHAYSEWRGLDDLHAGAAEGATLVVDGRQHPVDGPASGFWLGPSLFDRVDPAMSVYADEIFGPVLSVLRCDTLDDALALVNANPYGNGAAIFTNDGGAARRFQLEVEAGMVGINVPIPVPVAAYSFGGWKQSLFGDTHAHGMEGVRFFTRNKVVTSRWLDPSHGGLNLGFPQND
jgi:hypothetical protein